MQITTLSVNQTNCGKITMCLYVGFWGKHNTSYLRCFVCAIQHKTLRPSRPTRLFSAIIWSASTIDNGFICRPHLREVKWSKCLFRVKLLRATFSLYFARDSLLCVAINFVRIDKDLLYCGKKIKRHPILVILLQN